MKSRSFAWLALLFALVWFGGPANATSAAGPAAARASVCGAYGGPHELVEPPDVDVWNLPLNATREHELVLAVHTDGHGASQRFCYRYEWNGTVQTVAPTIRVRRGEHFAMRIVNEIGGPSKAERVASTAIPRCMPMTMPAPITNYYVGYLNHTIDDRYMDAAPVDTNIHLHGYEGPASEENIFLSTLSNPMHACEYHVTIPATQPPGTYLYHTHAHGSSDVEVALGLDGVWIVEPDQPQLRRSAEHVIMLRYRIPVVADNPYAPDLDPFFAAAMEHEAALHPAPVVQYDPFDPPSWPVTYPMTAGNVTLDATGCNGFASEVLVSANGSDTPVSLAVPAGQLQLLRIVNGTSDSASALQLRDAAGRLQTIHLVGLDGVPVSGDMAHPLSAYVATKKLMLTSMSRADILLTANAGEKLTLSSEHYCEGKDAFFQMHHALLEIDAVPSAASPTSTVSSAPAVIADTPAGRLVAFVRANPSLVHRRAFTFTEYVFPKKGKVPLHQAYYITETTNRNFHEHPFWPTYRAGASVPLNPDITVKRGSIEEWYLINATMESHAFHIHQMAFVQERTVAGTPLMAYTVFVPVGTLLPNPRDPNYPLVKPRITKILLDFRHVPRGTFVFHCHMLFHEDHGMMATIRVV
ncbi:MAG: multicopper oxidase domain-containing protein [Candidatus Eremiobacteraeota bacterium]|nr:multicopper oxidase domain-containing protein [Candidatus Eremiobacteraeota bacterium]